jgi:hypothetical protein
VLALYRGDLCAGPTVSASAAFDTWLYRQATVAVARQALADGPAHVVAARLVDP